MRRKIGSKTEAQVSVEKMVADSNSPNLVLPLETVVASPSKNSTNEDHKGQDYSKSTVPEIKFTKERIVPSSQLGSPHGLAPQDMGGTVSALTSILEKQTLEPDDNEEADREARYRSRTRSCHADVPDKAIQAASAYNITLANRDHQKQNSMGARDSSSFYIGSTPATNTYDPTSLGTFQMSDKFRCTIHLAQILPVITRVSNHRGRIYSRDTEDEKGRIPPLAFPPPHPLYPGYTRVLELQPSKSIGGTSPRERATSTNNPSTMVGLATSSFVQLQVSRERTAEEIIWKAIRSYLKIIGQYSEMKIANLTNAYKFQLYLGEEDGSLDETAPPLGLGRRVAETGGENFVVQYVTPITEQPTADEKRLSGNSSNRSKTKKKGLSNVCCYCCQYDHNGQLMS